MSLHCSFCGKSDQEVRKIIAGPSVFICDECVVLSYGLLVTETPAPPIVDVAAIDVQINEATAKFTKMIETTMTTLCDSVVAVLNKAAEDQRAIECYFNAMARKDDKP